MREGPVCFLGRAFQFLLCLLKPGRFVDDAIEHFQQCQCTDYRKRILQRRPDARDQRYKTLYSPDGLLAEDRANSSACGGHLRNCGCVRIADLTNRCGKGIRCDDVCGFNPLQISKFRLERIECCSLLPGCACRDFRRLRILPERDRSAANAGRYTRIERR